MLVCKILMMSIITTQAANALINKNVYYKEVAKADSFIFTTIAVNNTVIFLSYDNNMYSYDVLSSETKIIAGISVYSYCKGTAYMNNFYIGSTDGNVYAYDPSQTGLKIVARAYNSTVLAVTSFNDKIYYGSEVGSLYELTPDSGEIKNLPIENTDAIYGIAGSSLTGKIYFGGLQEFNLVTGQQRLVGNVTSNNTEVYDLIPVFGKIYFGGAGSYLYEYNPEADQYRTVCSPGEDIHQITSMNNKIYFVRHTAEIYEYDPFIGACVVIANTTETLYSITALNTRLYAGGRTYLHEYYEEFDLDGLISINNLNEIYNNTEKSILAELNFRNPEINILLLDVSNITKTDAIVKAKLGNNRYFGQKIIHFALRENHVHPVLNWLELIEKGLFLSYNIEHQEVGLKEIINISMDYVDFQQVQASGCPDTSAEETNRNKICFETVILSNNFNKTQVMQTPDCKYNKEVTITTQMTNGLFLNEQNEQVSGWIHELGAIPFSNVDKNVCSAGRDHEYADTCSVWLTGTWGISQESNSCGTSDEIVIPSQSIEIEPYQKYNVTAYMDVTYQQVTMRLKQDIFGQVVANMSTLLNEQVQFEISVNKLMFNLGQYDLLPPEISVNDIIDNSVSFKGKLIRSLEKSSSANIEYNRV